MGRISAKQPRTKRDRLTKTRVGGAERRERAFALRVQGKTFQAIGAELGVNTKTAWALVMRHLEKLKTVTDETAEQLRALEVARLDKIINALMPHATGKKAHTASNKAVDRVLRAQERKARFLALDLPQTVKLQALGDDGALPVFRVELTNPERPEIAVSAEPQQLQEGDHGADHAAG